MSLPTQQADYFKQNDAAIWTVPADDYNQTLTFQSLGIIEGATQPIGDLTPVHAPDIAVPGRFVIVDVLRSAPDLGELTYKERVSKARPSLAQRLKANDCPYLIYAKFNDCARADVFSNWQALVVFWNARVSELDLGAFRSYDENAVKEYTSTLSQQDTFFITPITLAEKAASVVIADVVDGIYNDDPSCGACTPYSDGCAAKFALTNQSPASTGLSGQCVFTKDGVNYDTDDINTLSGANGTSIAGVGPYVVVTQSTPTAQHHVALATAITETPNADNWTAVDTGYVVSGGGTCNVIGNANRLFIGGESGYIYATEDVLTGVDVIHNADLTTENFNALDYNDGSLLAVGDNGVILLSTNADNPFSQIAFSVIDPDSSLTGIDITACAIHNPTNFEIGTANGQYWYTTNGGDTWTRRNLPVSNLTAINDIAYSPTAPFMGAMAVQTATTGYILRTVDGGRSWYNLLPFIKQISGVSVQVYNFVTLCGPNAVFTGGGKASSTDGVLAEAT